MFNTVRSSLATLSALALVAVIGTLSAKAANAHCYDTETNATVCILSVRNHKTNPTLKLVKSSINGNVSVQEVYCNPAYRNNYKPNMYGIACYEYGN